MVAVRRIGTDERRARLGIRHHLAAPASDVEMIATNLVGLHSSDPATVYLSAWARARNFDTAELDAALYDTRTLVRMLGMRRTMFVVSRDVAAVMDAACTQALAPRERKRLVTLLADQGITTRAESWLAEVEGKVLAALEERGEATANELVAQIPELGRKLSFGEGRKWAGTVGVSTRVLFLLATEGRIVRGRPLGGWTSSQYRWARTEVWLGQPLDRIDPATARTELLRRWLTRFGPGTVTDIRWWTGWTARHTTAALVAVGAAGVELDNGIGWVLSDDLEPVQAPDHRVTLLPSLDPTVMGWKERSWYLGPHQALLYDRNGNAGPTAWCDGRIIGGWAQRPDGEVVVELLEDVGRDVVSKVDAVAARLTEWLAPLRVIPRFRTPLERRLTG